MKTTAARKLSGTKLTWKLYDKIIKRPSKSYETIPLKCPYPIPCSKGKQV
jgi:hypothetical protein